MGDRALLVFLNFDTDEPQSCFYTHCGGSYVVKHLNEAATDIDNFERLDVEFISRFKKDRIYLQKPPDKDASVDEMAALMDSDNGVYVVSLRTGFIWNARYRYREEYTDGRLGEWGPAVLELEDVIDSCATHYSHMIEYDKSLPRGLSASEYCEAHEKYDQWEQLHPTHNFCRRVPLNDEYHREMVLWNVTRGRRTYSAIDPGSLEMYCSCHGPQPDTIQNLPPDQMLWQLMDAETRVAAVTGTGITHSFLSVSAAIKVLKRYIRLIRQEWIADFGPIKNVIEVLKRS